MLTDVLAPNLPESVSDALIALWHKQVGDAIRRDENLVDLETDKVILEVPAQADGVLVEIVAPKGARIRGGDRLAVVEVGAAAATSPAGTDSAAAPPAPDAPPAPSQHLAPSARKRALAGDPEAAPTPLADVPRTAAPTIGSQSASTADIGSRAMTLGQRRVPMSPLRARIAQRLLAARQQTAMLTTFNEVDLSEVVRLRKTHGAAFEQQHGVKLGFMSFFVRAAVEALKRFPTVNAAIDGEYIVYNDFYDVGIAVSTDRGLIVPILRNADQLAFQDIERAIAHYAIQAREGRIALDDLAGGTFTITNGGIFGSLLSTPIINPPQSAILGMHAIKERPIADNGQVVIRPMMYVALSYDHRLIDGREAVQFLVAVKVQLEDPHRMLLGL